jgi:ATP-dependent DNA helicase RecG
MVVEHAERFGLSALHQLRGRVGRAEHQSYAFLVYNPEITDDARTRLRAMKTSSDGFEIAEQDLMIRGPGDLVGVRQSGRFKLTIADIMLDIDLLKTARSKVEELLRKDPGLIDRRNSCIRRVLNSAPPFSEELAAGG